MATEVHDNTRSHRFELEIDDQVAKSWYRLQGNVITFTHTEVPTALEGRGIGSNLAKGALDAVRAAGLKVVALCPFIAGYIGRHREYQDLLADPKESPSHR
ncbi:MAG TPA: GNAT family N-acetyltransferase [Bauldia sp.]|nr:GNAT family N-acetyltransferase [Bauldia sp.]